VLSGVTNTHETIDFIGQTALLRILAITSKKGVGAAQIAAQTTPAIRFMIDGSDPSVYNLGYHQERIAR
jgi:hypothetical protein